MVVLVRYQYKLFRYEDFSAEDAQKVKDLEKVTNHDVKAVEYWIKHKFEEVNHIITHSVNISARMGQT
jgi:adenylosuccinate lyase